MHQEDVLFMKSRIWMTALLALLVAALIGGLGYRAYVDANRPQLTFQERLRAGVDGAQAYMFFDIDDAGGVVVAVGEAGQVRRSTDQGKTWQAVATPTESTLAAVTFADPQTVWAAGHQGTILRSSDAGLNWKPVTVSAELPEGFVAFDVLFTSPDTGYIAGSEGTLLTTTDGGDQWAEVPLTYRQSDGHFYRLHQLSSGDIVITTAGGSLLRRSADTGEWALESVGWSREPLYGVLELGDGSLMAYGTGGVVFQRLADSDDWEKLEVTSEADFYSGFVTGDGTVALAGNRGVIMRRMAGAKAFYADPDLPRGAILATDRLADGTLLLAGRAGLGRRTTEGYEFVGQEAGSVGQFRKRQLRAMPLTGHLLSLEAHRPSYWGRPREQASEVRWFQWQLAMRSSDEDRTSASDLLTPGIYQQVASFQEDLAQRLDIRPSRAQSVWSGSLEMRLMAGRYRRGILHVTADTARYDELGEPERLALVRRIEEGGYQGIYTSLDYTTASFVVDETDIRDRVTPENAVELAGQVNALASSDAPFEVTGAQRFRLRVVDAEPQPESADAASANDGPAIQAYSVTLDPEIRRCESGPVVSAAMALQAPVSALEGTGTTLSVADQASWIRASEEEGSWKWFAPGATPRYSSASYGHWGDDECPSVVMLVYPKPGSRDLRPALADAIDKTLASADSGLTPKDLVIKAYALERTAFPAQP